MRGKSRLAWPAVSGCTVPPPGVRGVARATETAPARRRWSASKCRYRPVPRTASRHRDVVRKRECARRESPDGRAP
eukprot:ctg_999.g502